MKNILGIFVIIFMVIFAGNTWADEATLQKEFDRLKHRLEELEKKKEAPESGGSGGSEGIANKITFSGKLWGRKQDNIGIGYMHLSCGNQDIDWTQVAEGYVRFGLNEIFALTLDVQYLDDKYKQGAGDDVDGWITGIRLTAEF